MKLLLDQGLPRSAAALLRDTGLDTVHAAECGLATASDEQVLATATEQGRAVVTLDADFHAILALSGLRRPSVIRIRIEGLRAEPLANLVRDVLKRCGDDLAGGALVSLTPKHARVHRLPVRRGSRAT